LSLLLSLGVGASFAGADTVYKNGDWLLDDSQPQEKGLGICRAVTATRFSDGTIYDLTVQADKSGQTPLQLFIRAREAQSAVKVFTASLGNFGTHVFSALPLEPEARPSFWAVPADTLKMIEYIQRFNQFNVKSVAGPAGELPFSLRGSNKTVNELMSRCGSQTADMADFEGLFLKTVSVPVEKLNETLTSELRTVYENAYLQYLQLKSVKADLAALEERFQKDTREYNRLTEEIRSLSEEKIPGLQTEKSSLLAEIENLRREKQNLEASMPELQRQLEEARSRYAQASKDLEPFVAEHDRLSDRVKDARADLSRANRDLQAVNSDLDQQRRVLSNLQSRVDQLSKQLQSMQWDLDRARDEARRAQNEASRFNQQQELDRRIRQNGRLNQISQRQQVLKSQVQMQERDVQQARQRVTAAEQALRQCQTRPHSETSAAALIQSWILPMAVADEVQARPPKDHDRGPGKGDRPRPPRDHDRPGKPDDRPKPPTRPNPPGRPTPPPSRPTPPPSRPNPPPTRPNPPPRPPAPDCSAQQAQLRQAQSRLNQAQNQLNQTQREITQLQNEDRQIRNQIQNQVQLEWSRLQTQARQAQNRVSSLENQEAQLRRERDDINLRQIPSVEGRVRGLESSQSSLQSQVAQAQRDVSAAQDRLSSYDQSVNYQGLQAKVDQALLALNGKQTEIRETQSRIEDTQARITADEGRATQIESDIASAEAQLENDRLQAQTLEERLAPYREQKDQLTARIQSLQGQLEELSRHFYELFA
jgi:predicted  nucleic acid-binding Zn-ribbon protein